MTLHQVAQFAEDLDRATEFYVEHLGATFIAQFTPPGLAFFQLGNVRLLLERGTHRSMLYFAVDDVEAVVARMRERGVEIITEPHVIFTDTDTDTDGIFGAPGTEERMAFVRDSEGNDVGLVSVHPSTSAA